MIYFFLIAAKYIKKLSAFDTAESQSKEMWSVSYIACVDLIEEII